MNAQPEIILISDDDATGYALPCAGCGIRVDDPVHIETVRAEGGLTPLGQYVATQPMHTPLTRCVDCRAIRTHATHLLDEFPSVKRAIGSQAFALARVESALQVCEVLGIAPPRITTDRELWQLLEHLDLPGRAADYSGRHRGLITARTGELAFTAWPWSHVDGDARDRMRSAYAEYLRARIAKPRPVSAPDGRGCMFCGVGAVEAMPSEAGKAWYSREAEPYFLGGKRSPDRVDGYVCTPCNTAVDEAGGIGPSALERAVAGSLGVNWNRPGRPRIDGLRGWAVSGRSKPNGTPWAHLGDLDRIRELMNGVY